MHGIVDKVDAQANREIEQWRHGKVMKISTFFTAYAQVVQKYALFYPKNRPPSCGFFGRSEAVMHKRAKKSGWAVPIRVFSNLIQLGRITPRHPGHRLH